MIASGSNSEADALQDNALDGIFTLKASLIQRFGNILDDMLDGVSTTKEAVYQGTDLEGANNDEHLLPATRTKGHSRRKSRLFGIPSGNTTSQFYLTIRHLACFPAHPVFTACPNSDDYELKYPEDPYGEEVGATARVWRTYLDEAQKADAELIAGWRDTTDVLLVFAGLFSAVIATFVVQTSTNLQPNYTQITASLLFEQNSLLRAMANHSSLDIIPPSPLSPNSDFPISVNDRWVNGLWFTSLSMSLVAAFMTVLVKQWMQHYQSIVFGTPHEQVRIRQFRFLGVERWHMSLIISTLPILLHISLLLYFVGLILFLMPLDALIAYTTIIIAGSAYLFYLISNFLPLLRPMCPYKTPISSLLALSISKSRALYFTLMQWFRTIFHSIPDEPPEFDWSPFLHGYIENPDSQHVGRRALHHMKDAEKEAALEQADSLDAEALVWLYLTSSNPTVANITVQAVSGLRLGFSASAKDILKQSITFKHDSFEDTLLRKLLDFERQHGCTEVGRMKVERFLRACHQLELKLIGTASLESIMSIRDIDNPGLVALTLCHSLLDEYYSPLREDTPIAFLESYDYRDEIPTPFVWSLLLRRCQMETFGTPTERWSHGFHVLHRFGRSIAGNNPKYDNDSLRLAMLLEYFCSLSTSGSAHWGDHSVLRGSPFHIAKVLPQICSALHEGLMNVFHSNDTSASSPGRRSTGPRLGLPEVLNPILTSLRHDLAVSTEPVGSADQKKITEAASTLRLQLQKLVESQDLWDDEALWKSRGELCELSLSTLYWPPWIPSWRGPWTPQLMDCFLQSERNGNAALRLTFYYGDPEPYRLFYEKDGLKAVTLERHSECFLRLFLHGLLHWKGGPVDRETLLNYVFDPERLSRTVDEFILKKKEDGSYEVLGPEIGEDVGQLFKLRDPRQHPDVYGDNLDVLLEQVKDRPDYWSTVPQPTSAQPCQTKQAWARVFKAEKNLFRGCTGSRPDLETGAIS